jgi:hypothetical protein
MKNTIIWFEINVADLDRAKDFYDHVLQTNIRKEEMEGYPPMGIIPDEGVNGALVEDEEEKYIFHQNVQFNGRLKAKVRKTEGVSMLKDSSFNKSSVNPIIKATPFFIDHWVSATNCILERSSTCLLI